MQARTEQRWDEIAAHEARILAAIDATLLRRRAEYAGQPAAWSVLCEAAHVATLCEPVRDAFITRVANERGADIALRLRAKAASIRAAAIEGAHGWVHAPAHC